MHARTAGSPGARFGAHRRLLMWGLLAAGLVAGATPLAAAELGYKLIVNVQNPSTSLSRKDASQMFLRKVRVWPHGIKVDPVALPKISSVSRQFSQDVHGKTVDAMAAYWRKRIFLGTAVPPPALANDAAVLAHVVANPGAIGYVSAGARTTGARVIGVQ